MIYLVSKDLDLFESNTYRRLTVKESLDLFKDCKVLQVDTETTGTNPHIDTLLSLQLGNDNIDARVVIDCSTIDIRAYKGLLESKLLVLHNAKFDLQFFYAKDIIPRKIYDTMIVEQLLYLGYPTGQHSYSLQAVAQNRLGIYIDKSIRGQIIWRGLDEKTILYGAGDITWLEKIMHHQVKECKEKQCLVGAKLECDSVPFMAYLEWCGIKLDADKWKAKMQNDKKKLEKAKTELNKWFIEQSNSNHLEFKKYVFVDTQGDLFLGYNLEPQVKINWASSKQVIEIAKLLGFDTKTQDKKTGEDKDTVLEKTLTAQKGIEDKFLELYFKYKEQDKVVSSFGQGHLDAINPITGRIHTNYHQLGASSGRMSCGSGTDSSLEKYKGLPKGSCKMLNMQQLPSNEETRSCFVSEPNNLWVSVDFSSEEARLAGDIYNDKAIIDMFLKGQDSHSVYAKIFFKDELKDIAIEDVKRVRPDLRKKAKGPEFS